MFVFLPGSSSMTLQSALNEYKTQPLPDLLLGFCECFLQVCQLDPGCPMGIATDVRWYCAWQLPTFAKFHIFLTSAYNGFHFCNQPTVELL